MLTTRRTISLRGGMIHNNKFDIALWMTTFPYEGIAVVIQKRSDSPFHIATISAR